MMQQKLHKCKAEGKVKVQDTVHAVKNLFLVRLLVLPPFEVGFAFKSTLQLEDNITFFLVEAGKYVC